MEPRQCGEDGGWCWAHGAPIGVVDGSSLEALYAGGRGGTVLRWADDAWERLPMATYEDVTDIYVAAPDSIWVAAGSVWHFDGTDWREVDGSPRCRLLAGTGPEDVWAYSGCVPMRFDGTQWRRFPIGGDELDAYSLLARGGSEAWVSVIRAFGTFSGIEVSVHAHFMRFDGRQWSRVGRDFEMLSTWQRYSMVEVEGEVLGCDLRHGGALRFDAGRWEPAEDVPVPEPGPDELLVYSSRGGFVVVDRNCKYPTRVDDGEPWRRTGFAVPLDDGELFCTSGNGEIFRRTASGWESTPYDEFPGTLGPERWGEVPPQLWAHDADFAWGSGPDNVLRVQTTFEDGAPREERLSHWDGTSWRVVAQVNQHFWDLAGAGGRKAWLIIGSSLHLFDGRDLVTQDVAPDLGAVRWFRVHTLPSGESFFTASAGGVSGLSDSLLVRHFEGNWSVVRRWRVGEEDHVTFEFTDLDGETADTLRIGGTAAGGVRVVIERDGSRWTRARLWSTRSRSASSFALDGDTLWVDGTQLPLGSLEANVDTPLDVIPLGAVYMGWGHRQPQLWVGEDRVWLASRGKAMYRLR